MRQDPGCTHFQWRAGVTLGTPVEARPEQMRALGVCESCVARRAATA